MPQRFSPDVLRDAILKSEAALSTDADQAAATPAPRTHTLMHRIGLPLMAAGQTADAVSTAQALKRPGTAEGNAGIYGAHPSAAKIALIKAGTMAPVGYMLDKMYTKHPKIAMGIAAALGGLGFGAAVHNSQVGKK